MERSPFLSWRQNLHPLLGQDSSPLPVQILTVQRGRPKMDHQCQEWVLPRPVEATQSLVLPGPSLEGSLTWEDGSAPCGLRKEEAAEVTPRQDSKRPSPAPPADSCMRQPGQAVVCVHFSPE